MLIPFRKPYLTGQEKKFVGAFLDQEARGEYVDWYVKASAILRKIYGNRITHLTSSCTASLEIAGLLSNIGCGDEFILPSYTFSSTANSLALRGAKPVFVDVRPDTLNLDEKLIEEAITEKTRAIIVVHYAGISCEMETISEIANRYGLIIIEDAAQGIGSTYNGKPLGTLGDFGAVSFHKTKNVQCGEGGLIILRDNSFDAACSTIIDKGTNYRELAQGKVKKYHWKNLGSSYIASDMQIAYLCAQLSAVQEITHQRMFIWEKYHELLAVVEEDGLIQRPFIPDNCSANGHIYYVLLNKDVDRDKIIEKLAGSGVQVVTHYEPLHLTSIGKTISARWCSLPVTEDISKRLLRLPLWPGMSLSEIEFISQSLKQALKGSLRQSTRNFRFLVRV